MAPHVMWLQGIRTWHRTSCGCNLGSSQFEDGTARHVVATLVLLNLNIALRQLTLGPLPVLRAVPLR